jgi:hypothetical protein
MNSLGPGLIPSQASAISGILPLKISGWKGGRRSEDLWRSDILLSSLARFCDSGLFRDIFVVVPADEERAIRSSLLHCKTLPITVICEDDIVPRLRAYDVGGWTRQQVIKLSVANLVNTEFYLTLDADVVLCKKLAFDHLVIEGKGLMDPSPKTEYPEWWLGSAQVLGISIDLGTPGMAITPAVLSRVICRQLKDDLECQHRRHWADVLLSQVSARWSEYTLYYLTAERHGLLNKFHTLSGKGTRRLFCLSNIWRDADFDSWDTARCFSEDDPGFFAVLQSITGISARRLRDRLRPYLSVNRPTMYQVLARKYWFWRLAIQSKLMPPKK